MGTLQERIKDYLDLDCTVKGEPTGDAKSTLKDRIDEYLNDLDAGSNVAIGKHGLAGTTSTHSTG